MVAKSLSPAQIKCLRAIHRGRGQVLVRGYRFNSAAILEQAALIEGDRQSPYWTWRLTDRGMWMLRLLEASHPEQAKVA